MGASLAVGNATVVKPAEDACLSVLRVAEIAAGIGLPAGALNIVTGLGNEAGVALVEHPGIQHVSFTDFPLAEITFWCAENVIYLAERALTAAGRRVGDAT